MRRFFCVMLVVLTIAPALQAQKFSTKGKEFWVSFMENDGRGTLRLFFSADVRSTVTINVPNRPPETKIIQPSNSDFHDVSAVVNPVYNTASDVIARTAIQIISDNPISVYAFNSTQASTDATLVMPVESLGSEYYTFCREYNSPATSDNFRSEIMVLGIEDNTRIEITPTSSIVNNSGNQTRAAGVPYIITLNKGDVYFAKGGVSPNNGDLSGTRIRTASGSDCINFCVFSGHQRTNIPLGVSSRDHLFEQMFPAKTWGSRFVVSQLALAGSSELRVIAQNNNTTVNAGSLGTFTLNSQNVRTLDMTNNTQVITANGPIAVAQYMKTRNNNNTSNGDPFLMWIPPIEQTIEQITFNSFNPGTGSNGWDQNMYVNIVAPTSSLSTSRLDAQALSVIPTVMPRTANIVNGVSYTSLAVRTTVGNHTLLCPSGCIANVYGMAGADSYGFLAGASLNNINVRINFVGLNADTTICPNQQVELRAFAQDSTQISTWRWILPDGSQPTTKNVNVTFPNIGVFTIKLVVERNSGCKFDTTSTTITVQSPVRVNAPDTSICQNQPFRTTASAAGGVSPYQFEWTALDNLQIVSATGSEARVVASASGVSRLIVKATDASGCVGVDTARITVHSLPTIASIVADTICSGETGTIRATVSGGRPGYKFAWLPARGIVNGINTSEITVRLDSAGTHSYNLTVTDSNGCTSGASGSIVVLPGPTVIGGEDVVILCIGDSAALGGTASVVGGVPPYTTLWRRITAGNANIVNPASLQTQIYPTLPGLYELSATAANGCVGRDTVVVDVRLIPDANAGADIVECTCQRGNMTIGVPSRCGVPPFVYQWSAIGNAPLSALSALNTVPVDVNINDNPSTTTVYRYVLTVVDGQDQTRKDTVAYTLHPCPIVDAGQDRNFCGPVEFVLKPSVVLESLEGVQYLWTPGDFLDDPTTAEPRATLPDSNVSIQYTLTVRSPFGCTGSDVVVLSTAQTLVASASATKDKPNCICRGDVVSLNVDVVGGTPPFIYSWTPSASIDNPTAQTTTASPLADVRYVATVTDSRGCVASDTIDICVEPVPNPKPGIDTAICFGSSVQRGEVATCGKAPFVYQWAPTVGVSDPAIFNPVFSPPTTTTYTLTVTDAGGASSSANMTITVNELPAVNIGSDTSFCSGGTAVAVAQGSRGKPRYEYSWFVNDEALLETGEEISIPNINATSTIRCVITDENGCQSQDEKVVVIFPAPTLTMEREVFVCPCESIQIGAEAATGVAPYRYKWTDENGGPAMDLSNDTTAMPISSPTQSLGYVVSVVDARGCTTSDAVLIQLGEGTQLAQFSIPDIVANPRDKNVALPIAVVNYPQNQRCPPKSLEFSVQYDTWLYDPKPTITDGTILSNTLNGRMRTIRIRIEPVPQYSSNAVATTLTGAAILGDPGTTAITVKDVIWGCSQLQTDSTSGSLTLDSLCLKPNGDKRLLQFVNAPVIMALAPNPANSISYVTVKRYRGEELRLTLTSVEGVEVAGIVWPANAEYSAAEAEETKTLPLELNAIPGVYRLLLHSEHGVDSEQLVIIR